MKDSKQKDLKMLIYKVTNILVNECNIDGQQPNIDMLKFILSDNKSLNFIEDIYRFVIEDVYKSDYKLIFETIKFEPKIIEFINDTLKYEPSKIFIRNQVDKNYRITVLSNKE